MKKIRTIVVEDEYLNRNLITKIVQTIDSNFEIVAEAENIDIAFELINTYKPDLIFLDIKMPGGNGFELLARFEKPDFEVVFITGFDEYALHAFNFNALDYVLKPIDLEKFKITLEKVSTRIKSKLSIIHNLKEILDTYDTDNLYIKKIPIHYKDKVELIDVNDIMSVNADFGCTVFKTINNGNFITSKQLSMFEFILEQFSFFIKINKGIYVNTNYIKNYTKSHICIITLINEDAYEVSRRKKTEILTLLAIKPIF
jgi:two-component system LytT family response regulator